MPTVTDTFPALKPHERLGHGFSSYALLDLPSTTLAVIYTTLMLKAVGPLHKNSVTFLWPVNDDLGYKTAGVFSIRHKCGSSTLDNKGTQLRPGSKSIIGTSRCFIRWNWPWLSPALTWVTACSF